MRFLSKRLGVFTFQKQGQPIAATQFAFTDGRRGTDGGGSPPVGKVGQWDFTDLDQSGHLLTAGFM